MNYSKKKKIVFVTNPKHNNVKNKSKKRRIIGGDGGIRKQMGGGYILGSEKKEVVGDIEPGVFFNLLQQAGILYKSSKDTLEVEKKISASSASKEQIAKYTLVKDGHRYFFYYTIAFNYTQSLDKYDKDGQTNDQYKSGVEQLKKKSPFLLLKRLLLGYPKDTNDKEIQTDFWPRTGKYGVFGEFVTKGLLEDSVPSSEKPVTISQTENKETVAKPVMVFSGFELYGIYGIKDGNPPTIDFTDPLSAKPPVPIATIEVAPTKDGIDQAIEAISIQDPRFATSMTSMSAGQSSFGITDPNLVTMTQGFITFINQIGISEEQLKPIPTLTDPTILSDPSKKAQKDELIVFLKKIAAILGTSLATKPELARSIDTAFEILFPDKAQRDMAKYFYDKFYNPLKPLTLLARPAKSIFETGLKIAMKISAGDDADKKKLIDELFPIAQELETITRDAAKAAKPTTAAPTKPAASPTKPAAAKAPTTAAKAPPAVAKAPTPPTTAAPTSTTPAATPTATNNPGDGTSKTGVTTETNTTSTTPAPVEPTAAETPVEPVAKPETEPAAVVEPVVSEPVVVEEAVVEPAEEAPAAVVEEGVESAAVVEETATEEPAPAPATEEGVETTPAAPAAEPEAVVEPAPEPEAEAEEVVEPAPEPEAEAEEVVEPAPATVETTPAEPAPEEVAEEEAETPPAVVAGAEEPEPAEAPATSGGGKKTKSKRKTQKGKRKNSQKKSKYVKKSAKRAKRMTKLKL